MNPQQLTQMYEEASALAEAGQHASALNKMFAYLRYRPLDGQALNDAATILFCLGRNQDAITCYEKAAQSCQGDQLGQVYWNLCEVYLQEDRPAQAIGLFDTMETLGLLNADVLNRTADALLRQELLGPAVELLLRSLQLNPDQEILLPMLDVIRSHRARTAIVVHNKGALAHSVAEGLRLRLPITVVNEASSPAALVPADTDVALFFGCGPSLVNASRQAASMRCVAILDARDICDSQIQAVHWQGVQTVILCGGNDLSDLLVEQAGPLPKGLNVLTAEPILNPDSIAFSPRKKGKRIAAVGPWDARHNPMFAVMCFQKLYFLDPDTRLHLAGEFTDPATERYVRGLIETLDLDSVVFLDGPVKDLRKWFKDKHYILSTAIDGAGLENVWLAMACGLRPVVHVFPGAAERLDSRYLFTLSEEFCEQVLHCHYDAEGHREAVSASFAHKGMEPIVNDLMFRFEKEISLHHRRPLSPSAVPAEQPPVCRSSLSPASVKDQPSWTNTSYPPQTRHEAPSFHTPTRSVSQIASEALAATQQLKQIAPGNGPKTRIHPAGRPAEEPVRSPQTDSFKYNAIEGLSVEELTGEGRGSVPFAARR